MAGKDVGDFPGEWLVPVGTTSRVIAETIPRQFASSAVSATTSGTMTVSGIWLPAGVTVSAITFVSGSTAESGGTNLWYALYKGNDPNFPVTFTLMAQSANDTGATSFAANTAFRKTLQTAQKLTYTGFYYVAYMSTNGAGAQPTLANFATSTTNVVGGISGMTPILSGTADAGLTTTAPTTMGAITTIAARYYAFVD